MMQKILEKYKVLLVCLFLTVLIGAIFYPPFYTSNDERNYIQNAHYLQDGFNITQKNEAISCSGSGNEAYGFSNGIGCVSKYNIGTSVLLYPFVLFNWQSAFAVSVVALLATITLFHAALFKEHFSKLWVTLFVFHPVLSYYSHKVFSEIFSMSFLFAIVFLLFYKSKWKWSYLLAGILSGFLVLIKYSNIVFLSVVVAYKAWTLRATLSTPNLIKFSTYFLGGVPFAVFFFSINKILYGSILSSGYSLAKESFLFNLGVIQNQWSWILLSFLIVLPLQLITLKNNKTKLGYLPLLLFVVAIIFFGSFPYFDFQSGIQNFILGMRLFVPIIPILLLPYIKTITELKIPKIEFILICVSTLLIASKVFIASELYFRTSMLRIKSDAYYTFALPNSAIEDSYILINDAFGKKLYTTDITPWVPPAGRTNVYLNK